MIWFWLVVIAIAAYLVGVFGYVVVSYTFMVTHVPRRPLRQHVRAMAIETACVLFTQPFVLVGYLFGERLRGSPGATPIILVHGYMQNRVDFIAIVKQLLKSGSGPLFGFNYVWSSSVEQLATRLGRYVEQVCTQTGAKKVDLIGHSLGGVVCVELLRRQENKRVRRCTTVGSPHAGVTWKIPGIGQSARDLRANSPYFSSRPPAMLPVACLSIASTHDNVVHPGETSSLARLGGRDLVVQGPGHMSLLFSAEVIREIVTFHLGNCGSTREMTNSREVGTEVELPSMVVLRPPRID